MSEGSSYLEHKGTGPDVFCEVVDSRLLVLFNATFPEGSFKKPLRVGMLLQAPDGFRRNHADKLSECVLAHLGFLPRFGGVVLATADAEDSPRFFWGRFVGLVHNSVHSEVVRGENHRSL